MKQAATNIIANSWTNRKVITTLIVLFVVCPFLNLLVPDTMCQPIPLAAASSQSSNLKTATEIEYEVKAAFIYNFMKFIEWPKEKDGSQDENQNPDNPMMIGILGINPFGSSFQPILNKEVHGRKVHLVDIPGFQRFYTDSRDKTNAFTVYQAQYQETIDACDVLFICDSEEDYVKELLLLTSGKMILTVGDLSGFAKRGGMVGFVKDNNKIRFEINLDSAQKENIKIRSQLLTLAKKVYETKTKFGK